MIESLRTGDVVVTSSKSGKYTQVGIVIEEVRETFVVDRVQPAVRVEYPRGQFGLEGSVTFYETEDRIVAR